MGGDIKYHRALALDVARDVLRWLKPLCERVVVAGSLRRGKREVGDVEILYIARFVDWPNPALLFGDLMATNVADHALGLARTRGLLIPREKSNGDLTGWGPNNKFATHSGSGVPIDFFQATPETWWNNLVCRTGGRETNTAIAQAANARGWTWHSTGEGFERLSGPERGTLKRATSEEEVFQFVGLPYLRPEERV